MKKIITGAPAKQLLKEGVLGLVDVVKHTLGPAKKHVAIGFEYSSPKVLDDGVMIAREVEFDDPIKNIGAQLALMVAERTNKVAGDGTTTSLVLAGAMIDALSGFNTRANDVENDLKMLVEDVIKVLDDIKKPVESRQDIEHIATISSGSPEIGKIFGDIYELVGKNAVISQKETKKLGIEHEITNGFSFPAGFISLDYKKSDKLRVGIDNPVICVFDREVGAMSDVQPLLPENVNGPLTVIAPSFSDRALDEMVILETKNIRVVPITSPFYGKKRDEFLQDLAVYIGAEINKSAGKAERLNSTLSETIITAPYRKEVDDKIAEIETKIQNIDSEYDLSLINERIARLRGSVVIIKVGMPTEAEQRSVMAKIEDTINSFKTALEDGILPGGGIALMLASKRLATVNFEHHRGLLDSLRTPIKQILENSGVKVDEIVKKIEDEDSPMFGYDAGKKIFGDLIELGVIDPYKVTKNALINSASIALMVLKSEAVIAYVKDNCKTCDR
jgi:chaperonin GroEL